jgi:hypothetical protein
MPEGNFYCPLLACPLKLDQKKNLRDHYKNHVFIQENRGNTVLDWTVLDQYVFR